MSEFDSSFIKKKALLKMRCFFNIDMGLADMKYLNHDKILVKCVNINNFNVTSTQILNYIKIYI